MQGEYKLAAQHGKWAYFGVVRLEVVLASDINGACVEFLNRESEWKAGVQFGIAYAFERAIGGRSGANVKVIEVRGHVVDTTEAVAAFVAANAFFRAINADAPEGLRLEAATGRITFPK